MSDESSGSPIPQGAPDENPLRSVHTSNMPLILDQLGISLMVTTYQSGKLVMLRPENGLLNTHFRLFDKPMGMAVRDGKVDCVTALGETDTPGGWRDNKKDGGILIDVASGEMMARGLSMPHSPRWHNGKLYLLHSGTGGFGAIEIKTGKYESIVELPGFTRGLSFCGPLAFIGLSQVRETAVFGGVPIAEKDLSERTCGVWVVNIESGEVVGFVKFEDAVQEIFAVEPLLGARYPELVNEDRELLAGSYELPDDALRDVPEELRK